MPAPISSEDNELQQQRQKARLAMAGEDFVRRTQIKEEDLLKRRHDAQLAMESSKHRAKREEEERLIRQREEGRRLIAEEKAKRAEALAKKQTVIEEQERDEQARRKLENLRRKERFEAKKNLIEDLKNDPNIRISPIKTLNQDIEQLNTQHNPTSNIEPKKIIYRSSIDEEKSINKKRLIAIIATIVVCLVAIIGLIAFWLNRKTITPIASIPTPRPLIFSENNRSFNVINLTAPIILNTIKVIANEGANDNTITNIQLYASATGTDNQVVISNVGLKDFLKKIQINLPPELTNYLSDKFMVGFYQNQSTKKIFFIFSVTAPDYAKSWIIKNEAELLTTVLGPFHDNPNFINEVNSQNIIDTTIKNKDARLIKNDNNQTIALYSWLDQSTLLIAQDETSFIKIIDAFNTPDPSQN